MSEAASIMRQPLIHFMAYEYLSLFMLTVTFAGHSAMRTVASARTLAGLFVFYQAARGEKHGNSNKCYDQYVYPICGKPVNHIMQPLPLIVSSQALQGGR